MKTRLGGALRRIGLPLAAVLMLAAAPAVASDAVLYRIFLRDGSTIVSYGEFAKVAGRVVLSIPLAGEKSAGPDLQLVSIPESSVDWEQTERYAEAARANRYAETRGEIDFSRLSNEVAQILNDVAHTTDPQRRLELANGARKMLAEWPARNHGYRAHDVAQLSSLLDEVVSELRVAAGQSRFDVSLVATAGAPPPVPLLPPPTEQESLEQALAAARLVDDPGERVALLTAIERALQPRAAESWTAALRARAAGELSAELRTERAYAELTAKVLADAEARARRADVKGIEALQRRVLKSDDELGRRRPRATAALLATLDARLDAARRLQLARDAWTMRLGLVRTYQGRIRPAVEHFRRSVEWLEDIRTLAGPPPRSLRRLLERTRSATRALARIKPPPELDAIHGMFGAAVQMAARAASTREAAVRATDMQAAWQASSAAAGALLLFERAREELQRLTVPPQP